MKVLGNRILVKEEKLSQKTKGGIVIQGREKEKTNRGVVVSVGEGAMLNNGTIVPPKVKVGDRVIYTAFSGTPIVSTDGKVQEELVVLNERDVLVVLDEHDFVEEI